MPVPGPLPCMRKDELEVVPPQPRLVTVVPSHLGWIFPLLGQLFVFSFLCCLGEAPLGSPGKWSWLQGFQFKECLTHALGTGWGSWTVLSSQELDSAILVGPFQLRMFHDSCGFWGMPSWKCCWEQDSEREREQKWIIMKWGAVTPSHPAGKSPKGSLL